MLPADIKAKQEAYAARPYAARVRTHWFSGEFRFGTLIEAVDYIHQQIARVGRVGYAGDPKRDAVDDRLSFVEGPHGLRLSVYECGLVHEA